MSDEIGMLRPGSHVKIGSSSKCYAPGFAFRVLEFRVSQADLQPRFVWSLPHGLVTLLLGLPLSPPSSI